MKHRCPICHKATDSERDADFPFCSARCRETDLGNWASEKYRVAAPAMDEEEPENHEIPRGELDPARSKSRHEN